MNEKKPKTDDLTPTQLKRLNQNLTEQVEVMRAKQDQLQTMVSSLQDVNTKLAAEVARYGNLFDGLGKECDMTIQIGPRGDVDVTLNGPWTARDFHRTQKRVTQAIREQNVEWKKKHQIGLSDGNKE